MARTLNMAKLSLIRNELIKCAQAKPMESPNYSDFAPRVGMPVQGPWKDLLDEISRQETAQGLPDVTFVLVNKTTGYPSQIGFSPSKKPTPQQIAHARAEVQKVINRYNSGTANPF